MRLFLSSLSQSTPNEVVANPFSHEATVMPIGGVNTHYAFPTLVSVGSRLYAFYRNGTDHNIKDGVIDYKYSDDDGETWSNPLLYYDGTEIPSLYPEYFTGSELLDIRGNKAIIMTDNHCLILTPSNCGIQFQTPVAYFTTIDRIPIIGNTLDFTNSTRTVYDWIWFASQHHVEHNGVIYATGYKDGVVTLKKSIDFGVTWSDVSVVGAVASAEGSLSEVATCFVGEKMVLSIRDGINFEPIELPNIIIESNDYGLTWEPQYLSNIRYDGQSSIYLPDGMIGFTGRIARDDSDPVKFNTIVQVWDYENRVQKSILVLDPPDTYPLSIDRGYGRIIKYRDKYFVIYYNSIPYNENVEDHGRAGVFFRQLNYNEETKSFEFGND